MCNVFLSHKHEDIAAAQKIAEHLRTFGGESLDVFLSEDIGAGENWRTVIENQLSKSNLLILIFTEPRLSWDWCLYETGLFMNLEKGSQRNVICLHTPTYLPPDPIKHLEAIPAEYKKIKEKFLKVLFGKTTWTGKSKPINKSFSLNEKLLETIAKDICSYFDPKETKTKFMNRYFILMIKQPSELSNDQIPEDSIIRSNYLHNIFGIAGDESYWQLMAENQEDTRWIQQLQNAMKLVLKGFVPDQIQATFRSKGGEVIRPIINRVDWLSSGAMEFHVLLVADVVGRGENIPRQIRTISTVLRMATRFRYEVIVEFFPQIRRNQKEEDLIKIIGKIRESILIIETEARSRLAIVNEDSLRQLYDKEGDQDMIVQMFDSWYNTRNKLFDEEIVLGKEHLLEIFKNLKQMNTEFMRRTAKRYSELVDEEMR